jgi:exopolysaccharide biosynthesis polyprenyl glycosylphosphotransferase
MTPGRRDLVFSASTPGLKFAEVAGNENQFVSSALFYARLHSHAPAATASFAYAAKGVLDRIAALAGLVLLLPLLALIALLIRWETPGPVLFTQDRVGFRQRIFKCYKFRTMYHHLSDTQVIRQATRGDARVTRLGRFLRRSSLDELPQLLNVLRGEMSIVGPRPHAPDTRAAGEMFAEIVPHYHQRHSVRPGITGWAQVNGWRGETRSFRDIEMRVQFDLDYIMNWSLLFDARIMLLTLIRMFNDDTAV